jgi:F0F1-type ATP synthase membrane subunit b/b'
MRKDPITQADEKIQELRALVREANEILKDAKEVRRQALELSTRNVEAIVEKIMNAKIDEASKHLTVTVNKAVADVIKHFEDVEMQYLKTTIDGLSGSPKMTELIQAVALLRYYAESNVVLELPVKGVTFIDKGSAFPLT